MLKIFLKFKEQYLKTEIEYTLNFWMMFLAGIITRLVSVAVPFVIFNNIPSIAGWSSHEIYLIMSFLFIAEGLCSTFFEGIWQMSGMVFNGRFDTILTRPVSPLFQVLSYGMGLHGIGVFAFGIISLIYCLFLLGKFTIGYLILCLFFILCGTIILLSIYLISNSLVFWYDAGGRTTIPYAISSLNQFARYPIMIYPKVVQLILLLFIPFAFIGFVPVYVFRQESLALFCLFSACISCFFFLLARSVFYKGLSKYESMGM